MSLDDDAQSRLATLEQAMANRGDHDDPVTVLRELVEQLQTLVLEQQRLVLDQQRLVLDVVGTTGGKATIARKSQGSTNR